MVDKRTLIIAEPSHSFTKVFSISTFPKITSYVLIVIRGECDTYTSTNAALEDRTIAQAIINHTRFSISLMSFFPLILLTQEGSE